MSSASTLHPCQTTATQVHDHEVPLQSRYFFGFDYLRAVMACAVVAWHCNIPGTSLVFSRTDWMHHSVGISDVGNFNFLLLAVPTFFLISGFLFLIRVGDDTNYLARRFVRIGLLYLFWSGLSLALSNRGASALAESVSSPGNIACLVLSSSGSGFWFFFSLFFVTLTAWLIRRLPAEALWPLSLVASSGLYVMTAAARLDPRMWPLGAYWNPLNFLPAVAISALIAAYWKQGAFARRPKRVRGVAAVLGASSIALAAWEWQWMPHETFFQGNGYAMPAYTRASLFLGAGCLLLLALLAKKPASAIIKRLSDYSLGIYCVHHFIMELAPTEQLPGGNAVRFLCVLGSSILVVWAARQILRWWTSEKKQPFQRETPHQATAG